MTKVGRDNGGSTESRSITSKARLQALENVLQRVRQANYEVGRIARRIDALDTMSQNLDDSLKHHVHRWSGSSKEKERGDRVMAFRKKKDDWERLGDKKNLNLLAVEIA